MEVLELALGCLQVANVRDASVDLADVRIVRSLLAGVPVDAQVLREVEHISFDASDGCITRDNDERLRCNAIPDFLLERARAGGLLAQLKQGFRKATP